MMGKSSLVLRLNGERSEMTPLSADFGLAHGQVSSMQGRYSAATMRPCMPFSFVQCLTLLFRAAAVPAERQIGRTKTKYSCRQRNQAKPAQAPISPNTLAAISAKPTTIRSTRSTLPTFVFMTVPFEISIGAFSRLSESASILQLQCIDRDFYVTDSIFFSRRHFSGANIHLHRWQNQ